MRTSPLRGTAFAAVLFLWFLLGSGFAQDQTSQKAGDDSTANVSGDSEAEQQEGGAENDDPNARLEWQRQAWGRANAENRKHALREAAKHNRNTGKKDKGGDVAPTGPQSGGSGGDLSNLSPVSGTSSGPAWVNIGPTGAEFEQNGSFTGLVRDSGRARAILPHPSDPNVVYFLSSGGGLWKTTNWMSSNTTWTPLTDNIPTTGGGSAAFGRDPNTIYLGLGDPYDQILVGGAMVKTSDGGANWSPMIELGNAVSVRDVKVDTGTSNDIVLVATDAGLWRSADNGVTYTAAPEFAGNSVWSIVKTSAGWLASGQPCAAGGLQCGTATTLRLSTDRGATWAPITDAGGVFGVLNGRTTLAAGGPDNSVVYAYAANWRVVASNGVVTADNAMRDVYRSIDGGQTWIANGVNSTKIPSNATTSSQGMPNMNICRAQCWYDQMIIVDPQDPTGNTVYIGGDLAIARSTNGGANWTLKTWWLYSQIPSLPYAHADHHAAAFKSTGNPTLIFGNDGGMNITADNAATFSSDKNNGLTTHLYYSITGNPRIPSFTMGGLQDNGTRVRVGNSTIHNQLLGGDGAGTAYTQQQNLATVIASSQGSNMRTAINAKPPQNFQDWLGATSGLSDFSFPFLTAMIAAPPALDPTGRVFFHFSGTRVWRSNNGGVSWTRIAAVPVPPSFPVGSPGLPVGRTFRSSNANISVSPTDLNRIAVGAAGGFLDISTDGGATWTDINLIAAVTSPGIGYQGFVTSVTWQDNRTIWVTSVAQAAGSQRILKGTIATDSTPWSSAVWTVKQNGLMDLPVTRVVFDPRDASGNTMYAATHVGIYRSTDGGANWASYGSGLPTVRVNDIYMPPDGGYMRIATYGRGVWELPSVDFVSASIVDNGTSCDNDGVLDNGETGTLTITLKNASLSALSGVTASVTSTHPAIIFPAGNSVSFSGAPGGGTMTGTVQVKVMGAAAVDAADFNIAISTPDLPGPFNVVSTQRLNYDEHAASSTTENFDSANHGWTVVSANLRNPNVGTWLRRTITPTQYVFWAPDNNGGTDGVNAAGNDEQSLVSPSMHVGTDPLTLSFTHRFVTESGFDGGLVEISTDGGTSWIDVVPSATYTGNLAAGGPFGAARRGFTGTSSGYPNFVNVALNLGTAYAGQDVRFRFRFGSDNGIGAPGWEIRNISVGGATTTPFTAFAPHAGVCIDALTLASSPNPSSFGQNVALTATVSGGVDAATGTVTYKEGGTTLGTATLSSNQATLNISTLSVGAHAITAEYGGDATHQAATSNSITQQVGYAACVLYDQSKANNAGSTVAIKLTLCSAGGANLSSDAITVTAVRVEPSGAAPQNAGNSNPGGVFRFDPTLAPGGGYIYNLKTTGLSAGSWNLVYTVSGDNTEHTVGFVIK